MPPVAATIDSGIEGYVVPSKGYEMMALGRPLFVVSAPTSELRLLVTERACGVAVDDTPTAIVAALRDVAAGRRDLAGMAIKATEAADEFRRNAQFARLVHHLSPA